MFWCLACHAYSACEQRSDSYERKDDDDDDDDDNDAEEEEHGECPDDGEVRGGRKRASRGCDEQPRSANEIEKQGRRRRRRRIHEVQSVRQVERETSGRRLEEEEGNNIHHSHDSNASSHVCDTLRRSR